MVATKRAPPRLAESTSTACARGHGRLRAAWCWCASAARRPPAHIPHRPTPGAVLIFSTSPADVVLEPPPPRRPRRLRVARFPYPSAATAGRQKWLQILVNDRPDLLDGKVIEASGGKIRG